MTQIVICDGYNLAFARKRIKGNIAFVLFVAIAGVGHPAKRRRTALTVTSGTPSLSTPTS